MQITNAGLHLTRKWKARKSWRGSFLFSSSHFLHSPNPTISEPGTGYLLSSRNWKWAKATLYHRMSIASNPMKTECVYAVHNWKFVNSGGSSVGPPAPAYFRPNRGPKGQKFFFSDCSPPPPPPYLRVWMPCLHVFQFWYTCTKHWINVNVKCFTGSTFLNKTLSSYANSLLKAVSSFCMQFSTRSDT